MIMQRRKEVERRQVGFCHRETSMESLGRENIWNGFGTIGEARVVGGQL